MTSLSTHVLDAASGRPAAGVALALWDGAGTLLAQARTDLDGRHRFPEGLGDGEYRLHFAVGEYFAGRGVETFYPGVEVAFVVRGDAHCHVPLLVSPFAYSTYRGS